MAKNTYKQITTPVGTAVYPHLRTTERFEGNDSGKYSCSIVLDAAATEKLMQTIENEWEMAKKTSEFEGKRFARNSTPSLGYTEAENGEIRFKAKTNAVIKTKTGEILEKTVPIFDAKNKPMAEDVEIGNGSKIRLCMLLRPFYVSSSIYGVQLLLKAVQVIEYVEPTFGGEVTADSCGFEADENAEENPFPADANEADF